MGLLSDVYSSLAVTSKENLKNECLNQLIPLPGVPIDVPRFGGRRSRERDSEQLIGQDSSKNDISTVVVKLEERLMKDAGDVALEAVALEAVANINLGCAYARLGRYHDAEEAFKKVKALKEVEEGSIAEQAANHNLEIVETLKNLRP